MTDKHSKLTNLILRVVYPASAYLAAIDYLMRDHSKNNYQMSTRPRFAFHLSA